MAILDRERRCYDNEICKTCIKKQIAKFHLIADERYVTNWEISCNGITIEDDVKLAIKEGYSEEEARWVFDPIYFFKTVYGSPPRWYQEGILCCSSKQLAARFCRQTGKSLSMMYKCFHHLITNENKHVMVIVPSEKLVAKLWKEYVYRDFINKSAEIKESITSSRMSPTYELEFCNGSKLSINIANDNCVGQTCDWLYADETALIPNEILYKIILTTASKSDAVLLYTSTPRGRGNHFYRVCSEFKDANEYHVSGDMVDEMRDKLDGFLRTLGETLYLQDVMAQFPDTSGGPFNYRGVDLAKQDYRYEQCVRRPGFIYVGGVDWNGSGIGTYFRIMEFDPSSYQFKMVDSQVISSANWNGLAAKEMLKSLNEKWQVNHWMCDSGYGHCLDPLTKISTNNGIKLLKDIEIEDMVLTHDGTYKKVTNKFSPQVDKNVFKIKAAKHEPIYASEDHSFLVKRLEKRFKSSVDNINSSPEWFKVKDIKPDIDFLAIPKIKYNKTTNILDLYNFLKDEIPNLLYDENFIWLKNSFSKLKSFSINDLAVKGQTSRTTIARIRRKHFNGTEQYTKFEQDVILRTGNYIFEESPLIKINRFINIEDEDFLRFIGFYIAEGNLSNCSIELTQYESNIDKSDFFNLVDNFSKILNVEYSIYKHKVNHDNLGIVKRSNHDFKFRAFLFGTIIRELMHKLCGSISDTKIIHRVLMDKAQLLMPLVEGLYYGDGNYNRTKTRTDISLTTTSINIAYQTREILLANSIVPSITKSKRNGFKDIFNVVYFSRHGSYRNNNHYIEAKNYFYVPIRYIKYHNTTTDLSDITVEKNNSFLANGMIVHNSLVEDLKLQSMRAENGTHLARIKHTIDPVEFGSWIVIEDPFTKEEVKKSTKAFIVSQVARLFEPLDNRVNIIYSKYDENLTNSLENYKILNVTDKGNIQYGFDKKDGIEDHDIDSFMLSIYGIVKNYNELFKRVFLLSVMLEGRDIMTPKDPEKNISYPYGSTKTLLTDNHNFSIKYDDKPSKYEPQEEVSFVSRTFNSSMNQRPINGLNSFRRNHGIIKRNR